MARRRMFSLDVVDTDAFLDMPSSAQNLYFHLGMRADDEGFVSSPKRITSLVSSSADDFRLLVAKGYIIPFESGVCVVRDWKINNYIQADRKRETLHFAEKAQLSTDDAVAYMLADTSCIQNVSKLDTPRIHDASKMDTSCIQNASSLDTQDSIELGEVPLGKKRYVGGEPPRAARFTPPTVEEVKAYCRERENNVDAERFIDFYASKGWKIGKNAMKDWRAAVRTWERSSSADCAQPKRQGDGFTYDYSYTEGSL